MYSFSQLQTFDQCPLKYRFDKVDGLGKQTPKTNLTLIFGSAIHTALELLYKNIQSALPVTLEQLHQFFQQARNEEISELSKNDASNLFSQGPLFTPQDLEPFELRGENYLNRFYEKNFPFNQTPIMGIEQNIMISLDETIKLRGIVDRVECRDSLLRIVDYKTSKSLKQDSKDDNMEQLTLYTLGLQQMYGKKFTERNAKLIYLHLEKEVERNVDKENLESIRKKYLEIAQKIEKEKTIYAIDKRNTEVFKPKPGTYCSFCPFQQICPVWKHEFMDDELISVGAFKNETIKKLIDKYSTLSKNITQLTKEKELLKTTLVEYAEIKKLKKLFGNAYKLSITSRKTLGIKSEYSEQLKEIIVSINKDTLIKIDTNALQKEFLQNEELQQKIQDMVEFRETVFPSGVSLKKDNEKGD